MRTSFVKIVFSALFCVILLISNTSLVTADDIGRSLPVEEPEETIQRAIIYLETQLNEDGGVRWTDESSNMSATIRVVLALAASHYPQDTLQSPSGLTPINFLENEGLSWVMQMESDAPTFNLARAGQLLTAVCAANKNPWVFGVDSANFIGEISGDYDPSSGIYGGASPDNVTDQVWAVLGLSACHMAIPSDAADWLAEAQLDDGSWNDGFGSFLDTTPLAVMALIGSGHRSAESAEIQAAISFFEDQQQLNGGWQTQWDTTTNANTTGMILQAIAAVSQNPADEKWLAVDGNPIDALQMIQKESGVIGGDYANAFSTADAVLGLSNQPLFFLGDMTRANQAFQFIRENQSQDGGWENVGQTIDVLIALRAGGWDPNTLVKDDVTPLDFVAKNLDSYLEVGPDAIGKLILGLVASGENPANFRGYDLPHTLMETFDPETNAFGDPQNTWHQAMAVFGLYASGNDIPAGVVETLKSLQAGDGGWEYAKGTGTWPDNTALAIQALLSAGISADDPSILKGLDFITSRQLEDGGWGDASTTSYVLMLINALGEGPSQWWTNLGRTPLSQLFSFQKLNGAFVYSWDFPDDNLMATSTAMLALLGGNYLVKTEETIPNPSAGLIVDPGDQGDILKFCLPLAEESTSGFDFLESSGLAVDNDQGFINAISGYNNPKGGSLYWSYWHWDGREWQFYETGAGQTQVIPGSIQAWYLASWETFPSIPPDYPINMAELCGSEVLKNWQAQPYLNYYDFIPVMETGPLSSKTPGSEESQPGNSISTVQPPAGTIDETGISTPEQLNQTDESQNNNALMPLLIISVSGLIILVLIFLISKGKSK